MCAMVSLWRFCFGHTVALWLHQVVHGKISADPGWVVNGSASFKPLDSASSPPSIERYTVFLCAFENITHEKPSNMK